MIGDVREEGNLGSRPLTAKRLAKREWPLFSSAFHGIKFCCEFFDDSGILFRHVVPLARIFRDAEKLRTGRIAQFDRFAVFVALPVARFEVFPFAAADCQRILAVLLDDIFAV